MNGAEAALARSLLSASEVRMRAREMLRLCEDGRLTSWRLDRARLPDVAGFVIATMRENYPTLDIPFHARWRHFVVGGVDRGAAYRVAPGGAITPAQARAAFDLAIVSVLLDAGAGPRWHYVCDDGTRLSRSEGLAVASLDMFERGLFSSDPRDPRRADASRLMDITATDLAAGFQVSADNPIVGLDGRADLLNALGRAAAARPRVFAMHDTPRPGGLFDHLVAHAQKDALPAPQILESLLAHLGDIWPSRLTLGGVGLGDTWKHPALHRDDATDGLVPFHKLSQWLAYSLIEPLQWAGVDVVDIDGLTGLPEYRNGGLFMDMGAIVLKNANDATVAHAPDSPLIVEWRALTVALLDEIAMLVRAKLGINATTLPLARVLEGGTWSAGRKTAKSLRADGSPPLQIVSDGTVF
jgi:hypothetical protein